MTELDLSIIIPAYLEEENLKFLLPKINDTLNCLGLSSEVLIIDTIEPLDNTKAVCLDNNVKYINRKNGNSYGDAIRTGIDEAIGHKIIFMDADGSHSPEFIKEMIRFKDSCDIVIASRYVKGGGTENNKILIFMSRVLNVSFSLILGIKCKDISNSFKLYNSADLKSIKLYCNNFDIVEEIIFKISRKNKKDNKDLRIKELPYLFKNRTFGKTKRNLLLFILTYIFTILKLRFGS